LALEFPYVWLKFFPATLKKDAHTLPELQRFTSNPGAYLPQSSHIPFSIGRIGENGKYIPRQFCHRPKVDLIFAFVRQIHLSPRQIAPLPLK